MLYEFPIGLRSYIPNKLSKLNHYAEEKSSKGVNASIVVTKAFKRAFSCDSE